MASSSRNRLSVGCSGWNYPHWRGRFYPEGLPERSWLSFYAQRFETVEVNATFYRLPKRSTVAAWAAQTPDSFVFAVKTSRYLTHVRRLRDIADGVELMMERLAPLRETGKLGPLLWQLPPNLARDDDRLAAALCRLPAGDNAFEFRHPSWRAPEVLDLLGRHGVALTIADRKGLPEPELDVTTATFSYVRFHHGRSGRRGNYSVRELARWRRRLAHLKAKRIYAYFNNDWEGFAPENAATLRGRAPRRGTRSRSRRTITT